MVRIDRFGVEGNPHELGIPPDEGMKGIPSNRHPPRLSLFTLIQSKRKLQPVEVRALLEHNAGVNTKRFNGAGKPSICESSERRTTGSPNCAASDEDLCPVASTCSNTIRSASVSWPVQF